MGGGKVLMKGSVMPKTITITGDSIPLPKRLAKKWRGRRVEVNETGILVVQSDTPDTFGEAVKVFREVGRSVTRRDLDEALRWARAKTNEELRARRSARR